MESSIMARRYGTMKAGKLKKTINHIREGLGSDEELRQLGRSFLQRPIHPIICRDDFEVVDGNRRLAGVLLEAGPDADVPVCITDESLDESAKLEIMMASAIHTRGLSAYEEYLGASQWMERNPRATAEQLGERIGRKPAMMSRILSLGRCAAAVRDAAASGLLGVTEWNALSTCPEEKQLELLADRLTGKISNRDQLAHASKGVRRGNGKPLVKLTRIKCTLPSSGVSIVASGPGLSLDDLIDSLSEAQKAAKKSRDNGGDIKSFQSLMAAKSKKRIE
jgi:ParB-like chromosome segregation protein Spo0J